MEKITIFIENKRITGVEHRPALVAEWAMPLAAVHAGQSSLPVRVEA